VPPKNFLKIFLLPFWVTFTPHLILKVVFKVRSDSNEQLLLKGLANNDAKAIDTIYKDNFNVVQAFVLNNNGSYDEARDVFQEAVIALYEKSKDESFVLTCQIRTYLFSISRRLWLRRLSQIGRHSAQIDGLEDTIPVEEDMEIHEKRNAEFSMMDRAFNSLGEPCKSILESYYIQKKDMTEIAQSFGYTNSDNAKNQKYKCLMRLKKLFFAQYNIGE